METRKWVLVGILLAGIFGVFFSVPSLTSADTFYACKNLNDGTVRMVAPDALCKKNETKISWSEAGGNITGTVILRSHCGWGSPENLSVYISGKSYFAHPTLDGNFTLSNIPAGLYNVTIDTRPTPESIWHHTFNEVMVAPGGVASIGQVSICCPNITNDISCICRDGLVNYDGICKVTPDCAIPEPGAIMQYCLLAGARLATFDLTGVDLQYADLTGADLRYVNFSYASFTHTNLTNANLTGANLSEAQLKGATMTGATLTGVVWQNTVCPNGLLNTDPRVPVPGTCEGY